jgi:hypothetical protein
LTQCIYTTAQCAILTNEKQQAGPIQPVWMALAPGVSCGGGKIALIHSRRTSLKKTLEIPTMRARRPRRCLRSCHRAHHFIPARHHTGDHARVPLLAWGLSSASCISSSSSTSLAVPRRVIPGLAFFFGWLGCTSLCFLFLF